MCQIIKANNQKWEFIKQNRTRTKKKDKCKKWTWELNREFSKQTKPKNIQKKKCELFLEIREMKMKTTLRFRQVYMEQLKTNAKGNTEKNAVLIHHG